MERTLPLLDLLDAHKVRATFFCVMGSDATVPEIVRLRLLASKEHKSPINIGQRGGPVTLARSVLRAGPVGHAHPELLREIVDRGHELQPHGWSHIQWQRNLANIDPDAHLARCAWHYQRILGHPPDGFASPGRTCDERALAAFDRFGLSYAGDLDGDRPFRPDGHHHLQLPVTRFETIGQLRRAGMDDEQIAELYLDDIAANPDYCCLFEHPDDLGPAEHAILAHVFDRLAEQGSEPITCREQAQRWGQRAP